MATYGFKQMTIKEKDDLFFIVAPEEFYDQRANVVFNDGLSMWKDENTWWGGVCFIDNSNVLVGGFVPFAGPDRALQGNLNAGFWIEYWPTMINWAHSFHEEVVFTIREKTVADLLMKIGGFELTVVEQGYVVLFKKQHTAEIIQNKEW